MEEYSEYFFENFKGGGGRGWGGGRKKKKTKNEEEDELRDSIRNIGIFFTLFAFIYYINAMFPKQTTSVLKRYEAFDYINNITYLAIAIIICVLLYMIVAYVYNNNSEAPVVVANTPAVNT
jgi:hypothetical protein